MKFRSVLRPAALLIVAALSAQALIVKPNVAPVVTNTIGSYDLLQGTTQVIDLTGFFKDPDASAAASIVTPLGAMNLTLDGDTAPITVANFLNYINSGRYFMADPAAGGAQASVFFHRSVPGFVIQGGGFIGTVDPNAPSNNPGQTLPTSVLTFSPILNEPVISNVRGTIAMAKTSAPNSATSQWFVNLANNNFLDDPSNPSNTGGFTVFGRVAGSGMSVADAIAALPIYPGGGVFNELPVRNYSGNKVPKVANLVSMSGITQISPLTFTAMSGDTNTAAVTISGNNLLINAKNIGSTQITVTATDLDGAQISQMFTVNVVSAPGRLLNIATRVNIGNGDSVLIAGFIMGGGTTKRLAIRAIGPSLKPALPTAIDDPNLQLLDDTQTVIASNDNWGDLPNKQDLIDLNLQPTSDKEAAILVTVPSAASKSYTAIVRGAGGSSGIGLVEVYDLDAQAGSTLQNLSTRGHVGTGNDVMIGGVISGGTDPRRFVIRAPGPSLSNFDVSGALPDPSLELHDGNGTLIDSNDDWQTNPDASEIQMDGLAPSDPKEPALIRTLTPGLYTAIVRGNGATTSGVALVEIYQVQ